MTIEQAAERIRRGEVVAFPTETVYGLGADARNPDAVKKIFKLKGRPPDNPLIVHISDYSQVKEFAADLPDVSHVLMKKCWPGPLTLVFKKKPEALDALTGGLNTVALRIPDHPVALDLIRQTGPIAAPSANLSGRPSPTRAAHVRRDFGSGFPVLEGGGSDVGIESTVLDVSKEPFTVLRPGKYTFSELADISGVEITAEPLHRDIPLSPGVKYTHYKPEASVDWIRFEEIPEKPDPEKTMLITHTRRPPGFIHHSHFEGNFEELARQLYDLFRIADSLNLQHIAIERLPPVQAHQMIAALKNRIEKAIG